MGFLHVLLAIAFTLALVWARTVLALEHRWTCRVLVIDVAITLFLGRPAILVILATCLATFPRSGMRFLMLPRNNMSSCNLAKAKGCLRQITWPLESFVTVAAAL